MAAEFDSRRLARWLKIPASLLSDRKGKVVFNSVRSMAVAMEMDLNDKAPPDVAMIARSVGFRRKEGGIPLMVPGFLPTAVVRARVAAGEDPSAIARSVGARKPNVDQAVEFDRKWSRDPIARKKAPSTQKPIPPARETRAASGARPALDVVREVAAAADRSSRPLASRILAALRLASGAELPPSLCAWLAVDGELARERKKDRLIARSFAQVATELADHLGDLELPFDRLPGDCYVVSSGSEQVDFLYAGAPDADGELPVLTLDMRELDVVLAAPGFDVWLAQTYEVMPQEVLGEVPRAYRKLMTEHARRSMGGKRRIDLAGS